MYGGFFILLTPGKTGDLMPIQLTLSHFNTKTAYRRNFALTLLDDRSIFTL
jgi:hypothetical protein